MNEIQKAYFAELKCPECGHLKKPRKKCLRCGGTGEDQKPSFGGPQGLFSNGVTLAEKHMASGASLLNPSTSHYLWFASGYKARLKDSVATTAELWETFSGFTFKGDSGVKGKQQESTESP